MRTTILSFWLFVAALPGQALERNLEGRVVDEVGRSLAGVAVCLIDSEVDPFVTAELAQQPLATTAADGSCRARLPDDLDGSSDRLLFVVSGHVHVSMPLHPHDGWPVVLPRAHTLAGRVVDADGEPVAGVRVEARDWLAQARYREQRGGLDWLPEPLTAVRTDVRGRFVMPGTVAAGVLLLADGDGVCGPVALGDAIEIRLRGRAANAATTARQSAVGEGADAAGSERPRVAVRAVDGAGRPVETFRCASVRGLAAAREHAEWRGFARSVVDSVDGIASPVVPVREGQPTTLLAVAPGMATARLELEPGATEATIAFVPQATLSGSVVDAEGDAIVGAELWVCRGPDTDYLRGRWASGISLDRFDPRWGHVESDGDGVFVVPKVAAGPQHLVCAADGYVVPVPMPVDPAAGASITGLRIVLTRLRGVSGTVRLPRLPVLGASIRLAKPESLMAYFNSAGLNAVGAFHTQPLPPGTYTAQLVLPRPLQQGAPDLIDLETVTITGDTERLVLDARAHMPAMVRGSVRASVPNGRLLVGASVARESNHYFGYASFECALATVAHDGSFSLQVPPGACTVFVLDLRTGMLLAREPQCEVASGAERSLDLEVATGACDVELRGIDHAQCPWLEMLVPADAWPNGIDRMRVSAHEYTKRIGCFLRPGETSIRLYLPPMSADLWLVDDRNGDLKGRRGEVAIDIVAGKTRAVTIELPR